MTDSEHILVVDDHPDIRDALARYLKEHGFRVTTADRAATARQALETSAVDLVVLDIMMPGEDGLSLCRHLRATTSLPVILLTAMAEDTDRIVGLEMGADDYVTKPFNPRELLARIKAVLRRTGALPPTAGDMPGTRYRFGPWTFDPNTQTLTGAGGDAVVLSTGESLLLGVFVRHPGRVLNRDQLLDLTRGRTAQLFDRAIDNQVSRLRKKLERDARNPEFIKTHWGGGYSFAARVEVVRP
ncbi:MAG: DNA-binding response regulator [Rhodospirillales bacterium CG15_BIG_FIL_POST_REV_8_21_14_020_66_15]|nr:MAG: DNA-binding response regulator [Rhodospirillales bacterium CG15_BIG_FIL_POST_REV_8_21_14_020_66_15]